MSDAVTITVEPGYEIHKLADIPYQFHEGISTKLWDNCAMLEFVQRFDTEKEALAMLGHIMSKHSGRYTILKVYG